jgi:hypothetical protein
MLMKYCFWDALGRYVRLYNSKNKLIKGDDRYIGRVGGIVDFLTYKHVIVF